jgi:CheY-like chemotaxis protein
MSPDVAQRVFDPFFTTKPKGEGTGLGLATVWGIVSDAGGRVVVSSALGVGTTITAMFPTTEQTAVPRPVQVPIAAPSGRGELVLVVVDEDAMRRVAERILVDAGYTVITASRGSEALAILQHHPVALLLTDVIMPGMLGPELVERARARQPDLNVLYTSGYSDRALTGQPLNHLLAGEYLEKPYTAAQLQVKIRTILDSSHG